ncbi:MAG: hypothetical protein HWN66_06110 [Candidatus Helarchaeota archaeon]|nr:hypothetical protein [Candidatus Helarchaeota archaeon]
MVIFNELSEKDFEKVGHPTTVLGEIFNILRAAGTSTRLVELCQELIKLYTGERLKMQFSRYKHFLKGIEKNRKKLEDETISPEERETAREHLLHITNQIEHEFEKLRDLIRRSAESKVPLGAYSEKIAKSEISTTYVRGPRQVEVLSASLLWVFSQHHEKISQIRRAKDNDPIVYTMKPLRVLLYSEDKGRDSLMNFLTEKTGVVEPISEGKSKLMDGLLDLFKILPFFQLRYKGTDIFLEMSVDIINIFYKTNLRIFSNKESEARDEVANQLIQILTSGFAENIDEKLYHKHLAILLSFILKNIVFDERTKIPKLDVERVYIREEEECSKISNIANILFLPHLFGQHKNVKVDTADVRNTLKLYFTLRRAKLYGLGIIRLTDDEGRITTTMVEEPKTGSLIYETQMIVEEHLKYDIYQTLFTRGTRTQTR